MCTHTHSKAKDTHLPEPNPGQNPQKTKTKKLTEEGTSLTGGLSFFCIRMLEMKEPQSGVGHGLSTKSWNKHTQLSTTKQGKKLLLGVRGMGHDMSTMSCNKHMQLASPGRK